jgi:hypothetical protein
MWNLEDSSVAAGSWPANARVLRWHAVMRSFVDSHGLAMLLQVNQSLSIQVAGTSDIAPTDCVVVAVTPGRVTLRLLNARLPPLGMEAGAAVVLKLTNTQGVHTANAQVAQVATKPHAAVSLRAPINFTTTQQRKFVRVAAKLPVHCSVRASSNAELVSAVDEDAMTADLSAGGVCLNTALPLSPGDEVSLVVSVRSPRANTNELNLQGRVLRVAPGRTKPRPTFSVGIELVHANQREQDALVLIVFDLERKRVT